jgi:membrane-associated phospholipid phosphatase
VLFGRERPFRTDDHLNFTGPKLIDRDFYSFPSGHTTVAFALSTVLSENSKSDLLKIVSFLPAALTAYSRIYENRHWLSDVVLGGIIGYVSAKFFVNKHESNNLIEFTPQQEILSFSLPLN